MFDWQRFCFYKAIPDGFLTQHKGRTFNTSWDGAWVLDSWNDLNVPYFTRPGRKKRFVVPHLERRLISLAKKTVVTVKSIRRKRLPKHLRRRHL